MRRQWQYQIVRGLSLTGADAIIADVYANSPYDYGAHPASHHTTGCPDPVQMPVEASFGFAELNSGELVEGTFSAAGQFWKLRMTDSEIQRLRRPATCA